jgi:hypothetical protein
VPISAYWTLENVYYHEEYPVNFVATAKIFFPITEKGYFYFMIKTIFMF